uniref:Uncharacterized protein n=2 Tax=Oryza barthii TaxID=65489 RepID=A0A0D3GLC3_9ORYZ
MYLHVHVLLSVFDMCRTSAISSFAPLEGYKKVIKKKADMDRNASANRDRIAFRDITNVSSAATTQKTPSNFQGAKRINQHANRSADIHTIIPAFTFTTPKSTQSELLAKEKREEKNRKQREWRARNADKKATCDVEQSLSHTELLAKERRDEKNRKQREYRAKRKAESQSVEESLTIETEIQISTPGNSQLTESRDDQSSGMSSIQNKREQRNKYTREYRARKKAMLSNIDGGTTTPSTPSIGASSAINEGSLYGTMCSTILQDPKGCNKEDLYLDIPDDWLHRNDTYRPQFNARKIISLPHSGDGLVLDGVTQCRTMQLQSVPEVIVDTDYVEFDSTLFEPANEGGVGNGKFS